MSLALSVISKVIVSNVIISVVVVSFQHLQSQKEITSNIVSGHLLLITSTYRSIFTVKRLGCSTNKENFKQPSLIAVGGKQPY